MKRNLPTKKNSGMTLLEVIIAVSIFAIAATILLQGFVTSGRINKKSNLYLEATSTAQNIMEEIKAKDFEEVALAFNYPVDVMTNKVRLAFLDPQRNRIDSGELEIKEKILDGGEYKDISLYKESYGDDESKVTASIISKDNGRTYKFNPRKEAGDNQSKYYFVLENVQNNHETFDALIEFDGGENSGYKKKTSGNDEKGKNDYLAPNIAKLDPKTDAMFLLNKSWDESPVKAVMEEIVNGQYAAATVEWEKDLHAALPPEEDPDYEAKRAEYEAEHPLPDKLDPSDVYEYTRRTCHLKLEEENNVIKVKAKYVISAFDYTLEGGDKYQTMGFCPCNGKESESETAQSGCFCTKETSYSTIYISETEDGLKNLFAFYYPNYNYYKLTYKTNAPDKFVLDNTLNYNLNFLVIKQRDDLLGIPSHDDERNYKTNIIIQEYPDDPSGKDMNWSANKSLFRSKTKLRTNINYDISEGEDILEREYIGQQLDITYCSVNPSNMVMGKAKDYLAEKIVDMNGLEDRKQTDRIYTVKVSVFKSGESENEFPPSESIVTLEGAKEN